MCVCVGPIVHDTCRRGWVRLKTQGVGRGGVMVGSQRGARRKKCRAACFDGQWRSALCAPARCCCDCRFHGVDLVARIGRNRTPNSSTYLVWCVFLWLYYPPKNILCTCFFCSFFVCVATNRVFCVLVVFKLPSENVREVWLACDFRCIPKARCCGVGCVDGLNLDDSWVGGGAGTANGSIVLSCWQGSQIQPELGGCPDRTSSVPPQV